MLTRKSLTVLAGVTLVCFALAGILGNHHHGLRQAVADIAWTGFLLGLLLTLVASALVLVRSRRRLRGDA